MNAAAIRSQLATCRSDADTELATRRAALDSAVSGGDPETIAAARAAYALASGLHTHLDVVLQPSLILEDP